MNTRRPISFYGVFIFDNNGDILFSERFKLVEARNTTHKIPNNSEITQFLKSTVIPYTSNNPTTQNSFNRADFEISEGIHLVILGIKNLFLSVIPHIENKTEPMNPIVEVSGSYSLLSFLDSATSASIKSLSGNLTPANFSHIRQLILQIMPFGTMLIHDPQFAMTVVTSGDITRFSGGYQTVASTAVPSWKTYLLFPHPKLELKLKETIIGSIVGKPNEGSGNYTNYDMYEAYGELRCTSTIQYLPDITLKINSFESAESISSHFCVKSIENGSLVFSPPSGVSQLLSYKVKLPPNDQKPPIDGVYKIKEDDSGLNFALTVNSNKGNRKISVQLPFPGRVSKGKPSFPKSDGQIKMSKKDSTIMWTVELEENKPVTLTATLFFESKNRSSSEKYYANVSFDDKKSTFSGISIDKDAITSNSTQSLNVIVETSYSTESRKYLFWETSF